MFPSLSVIIATQDTFEPIRRSVRGLAAQTAVGQIELVIVAPSAKALCADAGAFDPFARHKVVEVEAGAAIGAASAAGVRAASAPVVVMTEDHVLLDRDWAEVLIAAHRGPWAAVGAAVRCANPATRTSWADLFISYGPWLEPVQAGPAEFLPGHNTSYKKSILLAYGEQLDDLLQAETVLHWSLRNGGHALYLEPAVRIAHINISRFPIWVVVQFHAARLFAASRAAGWSRSRRFAWTIGAPMIPLVRLSRIARSAATSPVLFRKLFRALPIIGIGLVSDGIGQMAGYAAGAGSSARKMPQYEYRRDRYLSRRDQKALAVFAAD